MLRTHTYITRYHFLSPSLREKKLFYHAQYSEDQEQCAHGDVSDAHRLVLAPRGSQRADDQGLRAAEAAHLVVGCHGDGDLVATHKVACSEQLENYVRMH